LDGGTGQAQYLVGAYNTDTAGSAYVVWLKEKELSILKVQEISAKGTGGFPFTGAAVGNSQKNTDGAQFGQALAALGDVDGDGIPDCAISANNGGNNGGKVCTVCPQLFALN
jgi:hypothetical protein